MPSFLFVVSAILNVLQYQMRQENRSANSGDKEPNRVQEFVVSSDPINIKWHPDEHERQRHRDGFKWSKDGPAWLGTVFAILAFIISVFAFREAEKTTQEIRRQADIAYQAFIDSDRPIIVVKVYGSSEAPDFEISNVGAKPAYIKMMQMRIDIGKKVELKDSTLAEECHSEMGYIIIKSGESFKGVCTKPASLAVGGESLHGMIFYKSIASGLSWRKYFSFGYAAVPHQWGDDGEVGGNDEVRVDRKGNPIPPLIDE